MDITSLGFDRSFYQSYYQSGELKTGRIIAAHKNQFRIQSPEGIFQAELLGRLLYTAESRESFPVVGDWVMYQAVDEHLSLIHEILPRKSVLKRKSIGIQAESQLMAANVDSCFIVTAADRDFNLNRLERYLSLIHDGGVEPIVIINKSDLVSSRTLEEMKQELRQRHSDLDVVLANALTSSGLQALYKVLQKGKTYCLLGSSGVGKSSIINCLLEDDYLATSKISSSNAKGKHTSTHRELVKIKSGALLIDTPGMREVGLSVSEGSIDQVFSSITELAASCRFADCTHTNEPECAVLEGLSKGLLDEGQYENYLKLKRESERFQMSKKQKREKDKKLGKTYKEVQAFRRKHKS